MMEIFTHNRLITVEEVARIIGVKPSTILSWVHSRFIPFIKFGKSKKAPLRFNPRILNKWLENKSEESTLETKKGNSQKQKRQRACNNTIKDFDKFISELNN